MSKETMQHIAYKSYVRRQDDSAQGERRAAENGSEGLGEVGGLYKSNTLEDATEINATSVWPLVPTQQSQICVVQTRVFTAFENGNKLRARAEVSKGECVHNVVDVLQSLFFAHPRSGLLSIHSPFRIFILFAQGQWRGLYSREVG